MMFMVLSNGMYVCRELQSLRIAVGCYLVMLVVRVCNNSAGSIGTLYVVVFLLVILTW
jgi:hypothetical protein